MKRLLTTLIASLVLAMVAGGQAAAGGHEVKTVEAATEAVHGLAAIPLRCIPPALLREARGVAIIPHVVKAGLVVDGEFGHGVVLARRPDGVWSNPVFIELSGGGVGLQAGVEKTDLILVFKTQHSLDRALHGKGKLVLGTDASVAAGPVGRDAEAATDGRLRAEIYSYSRSRGLFAGVSLQGARLGVDHGANQAFYGVHGGRPEDVPNLNRVAAAEGLRAELSRLAPPVVLAVPVPIQAPPPPPPQPVIVVPQPEPPPPGWWRRRVRSPSPRRLRGTLSRKRRG